MDLSGLSDDDVKAIAAGDMSKVSVAALKHLSGGGAPEVPAKPYNPSAADARDLERAVMAVSGGLGRLGKGATDLISGVSPMAGKAADFVLPQDANGGLSMLMGGPALDAALTTPTGQRAAAYVGSRVAPVGEALKDVGVKIGGNLSEGVKTMLRYAERKGIKLTPADMLGSKSVAQLESLLEKTPFGSAPIEEARQKTVDAIRAMRDHLSEKFGTSEDASVLGKIAQDAVASESQRVRDQANVLYGRVGELSAGKEIPMPRSANAAMDLLDKELNLRPELRNEGIVKMAADVLGIDPKSITEDTLPFIRENAANFAADYANWNGTRRMLGDVIDANDAARKMATPGVKFMSSAEAGAAKQLFKQNELDLADFSKSEGGQLKAAHDAATEFYREGRAVFNDKTVRAVLRSNPEKIVDVVFRPGSVTPLQAVKVAAGGENGTAWQALRKSFVEDKLLPALGASFSPAAFQNALEKYGDRTLAQIFTPKELMEFKGLARVSNMAQQAARLQGTQGSARQNTLIASAGIAGAMIYNNPIKGIPGAVGVLLGPKIIADMYLSETGRKLLMDGFRVSAGSPQAAKTAASIGAYLAAKTGSGVGASR